MEFPAPGVVDPEVGVPERSVGARPEVDVVSQLPPVWPASVDADDPAPEGGHPKSLCDDDDDEEAAAPPLVPPPRLKLLDPLLELLDPPKLLELPNPDDPFWEEPNPLPGPF